MPELGKMRAKFSKKHDKEIFERQVFNCLDSIPDPRDWTEEIAFAKLNQEKEEQDDICEEILPDEYIAPRTPILDQESVGSCVAHSLAAMLAQGDMKVFGDAYDYSRGFIYGNRADDQYQGEGMRTNEALKQVNHWGDCLWEEFPYNEKYPEVKAKIEADKENLLEKAAPYKINSYYRITNNNEVKRAIYRNGGVVIAIRVYEDFNRDLHKSKYITPRGGHAMLIIGWTKDNRWIVQNSWGKDWGYNGLLYMDFDYPVSEFWGVITCQERPKPVDPEPEPDPEPTPDPVDPEPDPQPDPVDPEPDPEPKKKWWQYIFDVVKAILHAIANIFTKKK